MSGRQPLTELSANARPNKRPRRFTRTSSSPTPKPMFRRSAAPPPPSSSPPELLSPASLAILFAARLDQLEVEIRAAAVRGTPAEKADFRARIRALLAAFIQRNGLGDELSSSQEDPVPSSSATLPADNTPGDEGNYADDEGEGEYEVLREEGTDVEEDAEGYEDDEYTWSLGAAAVKTEEDCA